MVQILQKTICTVVVCNPSLEDPNLTQNQNIANLTLMTQDYLTQSTSKVVVVFFVYSYTVPLILYRIQLNQLYTYYKALTCPVTLQQ